MAELVTDPTDPRLHHGADGPDTPPHAQHDVYLVLPPDDDPPFVRPVRHSYVHTRGCGAVTTMSQALAETYARDPTFYGATYCTGCHRHPPVSEFDWDKTFPPEAVGS